MLRLPEFQIDLSRLFHSIVAEGKKKFLKKMCLKRKSGILLWLTIYMDTDGYCITCYISLMFFNLFCCEKMFFLIGFYFINSFFTFAWNA